MVFSSLLFLYIFLPVCLILYYLLPGLRYRNTILTIMSILFYAWGEPFWVILIIISATVDYTNGRIIGKYRGQWQAKASFIASIVINLALLASFKYANFFIETVNAVSGLSLPLTGLTLPIGISFYTFQTMSYSIDVYKGEVKVQKSFPDFLLFVSLFPQLIAGPILRYSEIETQLTNRTTTLKNFTYGITRFLVGLGKKVLIANYASAVVTGLFANGTGLSALTVTQSWIGIILYAFHIYFDFSGYSDMAIGLGHMFGFKYSENFNYPYIASSITDFWRRWHISLSSFFRDYVYIPLGGNRRLQVRNMLIVWGLTGLWHGASWNFVLWGLYFFVLLLIEKYVLKNFLARLPRLISILWTFVLVLFGWVLFYFTDLSEGFTFFRGLFGANGNLLINTESRLLLTNNIPLLIMAAIGSTPLLKVIGNRILKLRDSNGIPAVFSTSSIIVFNTVMLALCTISLIGTTHNPFIYFRF